jgi:hypothetical protein
MSGAAQYNGAPPPSAMFSSLEGEDRTAQGGNAEGADSQGGPAKAHPAGSGKSLGAINTSSTRRSRRVREGRSRAVSSRSRGLKKEGPMRMLLQSNDTRSAARNEGASQRDNPDSDLPALDRGKVLGSAGFRFWDSLERKYFAPSLPSDVERLSRIEKGQIDAFQFQYPEERDEGAFSEEPSGATPRKRPRSFEPTDELDEADRVLRIDLEDAKQRTAAMVELLRQSVQRELCVVSSGVRDAWKECAFRTEQAYIALCTPFAREACLSRRNRRSSAGEDALPQLTAFVDLGLVRPKLPGDDGRPACEVAAASVDPRFVPLLASLSLSGRSGVLAGSSRGSGRGLGDKSASSTINVATEAILRNVAPGVLFTVSPTPCLLPKLPYECYGPVGSIPWRLQSALRTVAKLDRPAPVSREKGMAMLGAGKHARGVSGPSPKSQVEGAFAQAKEGAHAADVGTCLRRRIWSQAPLARPLESLEDHGEVPAPVVARLREGSMELPPASFLSAPSVSESRTLLEIPPTALLGVLHGSHEFESPRVKAMTLAAPAPENPWRRPQRLEMGGGLLLRSADEVHRLALSQLQQAVREDVSELVSPLPRRASKEHRRRVRRALMLHCALAPHQPGTEAMASLWRTGQKDEDAEDVKNAVLGVSGDAPSPVKVRAYDGRRTLWHMHEGSLYRQAMHPHVGGVGDLRKLRSDLHSDLVWFAKHCPVGSNIEGLDREGSWCRGVVVGEARNAGQERVWVKVAFAGWGSEFDEWIRVGDSNVGLEVEAAYRWGHSLGIVDDSDPRDTSGTAENDTLQYGVRVQALSTVGNPDTASREMLVCRIAPPGTFIALTQSKGNVDAESDPMELLRDGSDSSPLAEAEPLSLSDPFGFGLADEEPPAGRESGPDDERLSAGINDGD